MEAIEVLEKLKGYLKVLYGGAIEDIDDEIESLKKEQANKTVEERVKEERDNLANSLEKLIAFIENESLFSKISSKQQELLTKQRLIMEAYKSILDARLEEFTKANAWCNK